MMVITSSHNQFMVQVKMIFIHKVGQIMPHNKNLLMVSSL